MSLFPFVVDEHEEPTAVEIDPLTLAKRERIRQAQIEIELAELAQIQAELAELARRQPS